MIEVENRFLLTEENKKKLVDGAEFIGEETFTDIYYDTTDASIMKRDMWLRSRSGRFEMKLPLNEKSVLQRKSNKYKEIESEEEIRKVLEFPPNGNFTKALEGRGYLPMLEIETTRQKYKKGEFIIVFDATDLGFSIGEIEVAVRNESEVDAASDRLIDFAKKQGVELVSTEGKVLECLKIKQPELYRSIREAGVV